MQLEIITGTTAIQEYKEFKPYNRKHTCDCGCGRFVDEEHPVMVYKEKFIDGRDVRVVEFFFSIKCVE